MKIYNYSDEPIYLNGHAITHHEVYLPNTETFVFSSDTYTAQDANETVESYYLYGGSGGSVGVIKSYEVVPPIWEYAVFMVSLIGLVFLIKIVQKLRTR